MSGPIGTVRWFGDSWGAPVCEPAAQVPIPFGEKCFACGIEFEEGDQGFVIPHVGEGRTGRYHLWCFLNELGIEERT